MKNPPKQVRVSSRVFLSSTSQSLTLMCTDNILNLLQDDVNVYRSMPPMPDIDSPSHLMPSTRPLAIATTSKEEDGDETDDDGALSEVIKGKSMKTSQEGKSSFWW
jgi:hypothetical protein